MGMGNSGASRLNQQLGDQESEERERAMPAALPLGDDEPMPLPEVTENDDGSASALLPPDAALDVQEQDDGSAVIKDADDDAPNDPNVKFDENLAKKVDKAILTRIARDLLESIERDKDSRKKRDEQYAEGIKRTGLGNDAPGGASFDGASKVVHPALVEGCVDFAARAMKELFPASGPVKSHIVGESTKAKLRKADRKASYMNWQCTTQIREYRRELEVLLTQLPLGGGQYLKFWYDSRWERIRTEFVAIDHLLLPFEATSLDTAERITHVQLLTRQIFQERIDSDVYVEPKSMVDPSLRPDATKSSQAAAVVEGAEDMGFNEDGQRTVYETLVQLDLEGEDKLAKERTAPYVVAIDEVTQEVMALYRNWDEKDQDRMEALPWFVEFPFIPWRGAYPIGLTHLIGGLAAASTGALRALLDAALINNMPGAVKLKAAGSRNAGQDIPIEPTNVTELEAGPGIDDIRKLVMPIPFNPPSAVLFQLLEWVTQQAKGVVATAEERIADASNNMPVGTALALIEQGSITFSAIHGRLHHAQKQALSIIHRLDAKHLQDQEVVEELGGLEVSRADFQGPMDIEPVSDPNIFSDAQRYAQIQAAVQLASSPLFAPLFKPPELAKRALQLLKLPSYQDVLAVPADPEELDPIGENVAATDPQKSLKSFDGQDHLAHLKVHLSFMTSPIFCANPLMAQPALGVLLNHCKEHLIQLYAEHSSAAAKAQMVVHKMSGSIEGAEVDGVALAEQQLAQMIGPLMPMLQQAQQLAQQFAPKPQGDPTKMAEAQIEAQAKQQSDAMKAQLEQAKLSQQAQSDQADRQLEQVKLQLDTQAAQMADALSRWDTQMEMMTSRANAATAAQEGEAQRQLQLVLQQQKEDSAQALAEYNGKLQVLLEQIKQGNEDARAAREEERAERETAREQKASQADTVAPLLERHGQTMDQLSKTMDALAKHITTPKQPRKLRVVRNADGSLEGHAE
jgi:hypothetical protein